MINPLDSPELQIAHWPYAFLLCRVPKIWQAKAGKKYCHGFGKTNMRGLVSFGK
jgi:hypothetical protein